MNQQEPKEPKEKPIEVRLKTGEYLSHCSRKRAAKMVSRRKARWIGRDVLEILITLQDNREIRKRVLERDGLICYICEETLTHDQVTYDHVYPRGMGGTDFEDNLAVCCEPCNEDKADRTPEQYVYYLYAVSLLLLGGYNYEKIKFVGPTQNYTRRYRS